MRLLSNHVAIGVVVLTVMFLAPVGLGSGTTRARSGFLGAARADGDSEAKKSDDTGDGTGNGEEAKEKPAKPRVSVDASDTVYGNSKVFSTPAEVDVDKVYAKISEYREISEKSIATSDPQHAILLAKASRKFNCAIRKAAKVGGYDLIAKKGTVKGLESVTDLTVDVIERL
jgi:Skp family chaperone for outer membrane proteins